MASGRPRKRIQTTQHLAMPPNANRTTTNLMGQPPMISRDLAKAPEAPQLLNMHPETDQSLQWTRTPLSIAPINFYSH